MQKKHKGPGRADREGIPLLQFLDIVPDEDAARRWFESLVWPEGRHCPRCGSAETVEASKSSGLPYRCPDCRKTFSVRTGTALARSRVPLRKWALAIYLMVTSLKGVSSMKLHRDLGVTQKTAWFMAQRIRESWGQDDIPPFPVAVEVDETYVGGRRKWMHGRKRAELLQRFGRGGSSMEIVAGGRDRDTNRLHVRVIDGEDRVTLRGFVDRVAGVDARLYTDEAAAYRGMREEHEAVNHSVGEYVNEQAHVNGVESFWSMLKRGYHGTYHKMSPKHLQRYVDEFAGRHNIRERDTADQMALVAVGLVGRRLMYRDLIADNGLESGAKPTK